MCRICAIATRLRRTDSHSSPLLNTHQFSIVIQGDRSTRLETSTHTQLSNQQSDRLPFRHD
jgi:hypothetical protein